MAQELILQRSGGVGDFLVNPRDYDYNAERTKEAIKDFQELRERIRQGVYGGTVRIVMPGDSNFEDGQVVTIEQFLRMVENVLVYGGEMPIAQLESEGKV